MCVCVCVCVFRRTNIQSLPNVYPVHLQLTTLTTNPPVTAPSLLQIHQPPPYYRSTSPLPTTDPPAPSLLQIPPLPPSLLQIPSPLPTTDPPAPFLLQIHQPPPYYRSTSPLPTTDPPAPSLLQIPPLPPPASNLCSSHPPSHSPAVVGQRRRKGQALQDSHWTLSPPPLHSDTARSGTVPGHSVSVNFPAAGPWPTGPVGEGGAAEFWGSH